MSVHQHPWVQGAERSRLKGATIAGLVTLACLIAVPVELLELGLASVGLSELLPVLAPPIGWPVRIVLALTGAAIAAVLGGGPDGGGAPATIAGVGPGMKRNGIMGWTRNLGLHHLARLARGGESEADAYTAPAPQMRAPAPRSQEETVSFDLLRRHRKDMHPGAPPRAPLVASRDLPIVTELSVIEAGPDVAPPPPPVACASPIRDTTDEIRPRPLPRSPAPLSDSDLSWVRGLLSDRGEANARPAIAAPSAAPEASVAPSPATDSESLSVAAPLVEATPDGAPSLLSLVDRFEQGVTHRIALRDAANAMERVEDSLNGHPATSSPATDAPAASTVFDDAGDDAEDLPLEMDEALNAALETLRKLSVKANGR